MKRRHTLLVGTLLAVAVLLALLEGPIRVGEAPEPGTNFVITLVSDPDEVLDQRPPGERAQGFLKLTKIGPHERVLPTVRDRVKRLDGLPVVSISIPPGALDPLAPPTAGSDPSSDLPPAPSSGESGILPDGLMLGGLAAQPFAQIPAPMLFGTFAQLPKTTAPSPGGDGGLSPGGSVGPSPGSSGGPPVTSPTGSLDGSPPSSGGLSPPRTSSPGGGTSGDPTQTSNPGSGSSPQPVVAVPEPDSWMVGLFGLAIIAMFARRRKRSRT